LIDGGWKKLYATWVNLNEENRGAIGKGDSYFILQDPCTVIYTYMNGWFL